MPKVIQTDDFGVFKVKFSKEWHTCDLFDEDFPGNGSCSCTDFTMRCIPNWKKHETVTPYWKMWPTGKVAALPNPDRSLCKHLAVVQNYFFPRVIKQMIKDRQCLKD